MRKILEYLKPYRLYIVLTCVMLVVQTITELWLPDLNADIINNGVAAGDTGYVYSMGGKMLIVALIALVSSGLCSYLASKVSSAVGTNLRHDMFTGVEGFAQKEVNKFGTPSLITRTTNDITQVQNAVQMVLRMMLFIPVMLIGSVFMALKQDVALSLVIAVVVPIIIVAMVILLGKTTPLFQSVQSKIDKLNLVMREKLSGIRVIRAYIREDYEQGRFDKANRDLTQTQMKALNYIVILMPMMNLLMSAATLAVYWFGAKRIDSGLMQIGNLTAFMTYVMHVLMSVMMSSMMFVMLPRAMASVKRVAEVLETETSMPETEGGKPIPEGFDSLEFRDVVFQYPGAEKPVLSGMSFTVRAGETMAVIGSTGSGKSTLINLIPRLYDITSGELLLNGVDVREAGQQELRARLGFIPQKAFLFEGTVESNLRYGKKDASEEEMWHALEIAQGKGFVLEKENGLQSEISQGGANLSGGQRQRMAIARALIRRPDVYIFDDSFSALDFKTDAALRAALKDETKGAAVIIVAQRVSTIMNADNILVMDEGRIAGLGKHSELMETCEVYREIVLSQLSEEEVAS